MNCPHCGKETEPKVKVKKLDKDMYINGESMSVLGVEPLTEPVLYRLLPKYRKASTKPPIIVYVEAE